MSEYKWVAEEAIAQEYLRTRGTLLFGTDWFPSMFTPDAKGYVEPTGSAGPMGHEIVLRWHYPKTHRHFPDTYEFVNSWGESWGDKGLFRMKADAFRYLWLPLNGDLVSPLETARAVK